MIVYGRILHQWLLETIIALHQNRTIRSRSNKITWVSFPFWKRVLTGRNKRYTGPPGFRNKDKWARDKKLQVLCAVSCSHRGLWTGMQAHPNVCISALAFPHTTMYTDIHHMSELMYAGGHIQLRIRIHVYLHKDLCMCTSVQTYVHSFIRWRHVCLCCMHTTIYVCVYTNIHAHAYARESYV